MARQKKTGRIKPRQGKGRRRRGWARRRWKRITSGSPHCISMNLKLFFVRARLPRGPPLRRQPKGKRGSSTYVYIPPILKDVNRKNNFCLLPEESKLFAPTDTSANAVFFFNSSNEHRLTENYAEGILIASLMSIYWTRRRVRFFRRHSLFNLGIDSYFQRTSI